MEKRKDIIIEGADRKVNFTELLIKILTSTYTHPAALCKDERAFIDNLKRLF